MKLADAPRIVAERVGKALFADTVVDGLIKQYEQQQAKVTYDEIGIIGQEPLPGETTRMQLDFTLTSSATNERITMGLCVAVQKLMARLSGLDGILSVVLTHTPPLNTEDGVTSRADRFAAIIEVQG